MFILMAKDDVAVIKPEVLKAVIPRVPFCLSASYWQQLSCQQPQAVPCQAK
jgi:hypothetical protein